MVILLGGEKGIGVFTEGGGGIFSPHIVFKLLFGAVHVYAVIVIGITVLFIRGNIFSVFQHGASVFPVGRNGAELNDKLRDIGLGVGGKVCRTVFVGGDILCLILTQNILYINFIAIRFTR